MTHETRNPSFGTVVEAQACGLITTERRNAEVKSYPQKEYTP